jgi:hypothetical protein
MKLHEIKQVDERSVRSVLGEQPEKTFGNVYYNGNRLTSLEGASQSVDGNVYCGNNRLTSLNGAPKFISGSIDCNDSGITSLQDVHKHVTEVGGTFYCNTVKSHVLGLFLIKGLQHVMLGSNRLNGLVNKHLPSKGRTSMVACAEELINAGFEEYAQL